MSILHTASNTFYPTPEAFKAAQPNTSFPLVLSEELLASYGCVPVFEGPHPAEGSEFAYHEGFETSSNGHVFKKYVHRPPSINTEEPEKQQEP